MRNEPLYRAMTKLFKEQPVIVNADVPAAITFPPPIVSIDIDRKTPIDVGSVIGGEQYAVNCPFCGDTRHRLYISAMWNANIKLGSYTYVCSDFLLRCFNQDCQKIPSNRAWLVDNLNKLLGDPEAISGDAIIQEQSSEVSAEGLANQVPLPPHMADIEHSSVPQYIRDYWYNVRGFSADTLRKYGVKIAYLPYPIKRGCKMMEQPVTIIPVYQYGQFWFFQARLIPINGDPKNGYERNLMNDEYPKYYIPRGAKKSWTLYNLDNAVKYEEVAIVEGVTDVWRIGKAVAKFGRSLSVAQRGVLVKMFRNKSILLVPDMDDPLAYEEACKDQMLLKDTGAFKDVRISVIEKGVDPGDLRINEEEVWQYLQNRLGSQGEPSSETCGLMDYL